MTAMSSGRRARQRHRVAVLTCNGIVAAACAIGASTIAWAQGSPPPAEQPAPPPVSASSELPTIADLRRRIDSIKAAENPTDADKARLTQLTAIAESMERSEKNRAKAAEWRDTLAQRSARLESLRADRPKLEAPSNDASIEKLDQALGVVTAEVAAARDAISKLDAVGAQLAERRRALPEELATARSELGTAQQKQEENRAASGPTAELSALTAATRLEELASTLSLREAELASLDARVELAATERASQQERIDAAEALGRELRTRLEQQRSALAKAAEESARALSPNTSAMVSRITARNAELAQRLQEAGRALDRISDDAASREDELSRIERDFANDRERSRVAGSGGRLSELLRRQRQALPTARSLSLSVAARRDARGEIDLERIERTIELDALAADERVLAQDPQEAPALLLLQSQRENYLRPLLKTLDSSSSALVALEGLESRLAERVAEYREFIDQKVIWLRSGPPLWSLGASTFADDASAIMQPLRSREQWRLVVNQLMEESAWAYAGLGIAAALILVRPIVRRWLERLAKDVSRGHSDRFVLTLEAIAATLLLSMAAPAAMAGLGLSLRVGEHGSQLAVAFSSALVDTSVWTALLLFTRRLVRRQGLAVEHYGWRPEQADLLLRVSKRLFRFTVPLLFVAILCTRLPEQRGPRPIATLIFLPCLALLAWSAWTLFRPSTGLFASSIADANARLLQRLGWIWFPLVVGIPVTAIVLTVLGWSYASVMLIDRLVASAALGLATAVLTSTLHRALEFGARAFARKSSAHAATVHAGLDGALAAQKKEIRQDVAAVSRQTLLTIRALTTVILLGGLMAIWHDLIPALRALDGIELWQGANGAVSLAGVLVALLIAVGAIFAATNLPGAVEILLLQHAGMTPAGRYATAAVMRYALVIVAILLAAHQIGLSWSSVQWLVAAVGVGLGFGLQEVVGNFVSGLIVLFEQPVRIGDVITVGDRTGQVVKIRIRATTIRDGDGRDLIVPNKHLITERVTNWTLPGAPLRLVLPVSVSYGTDLALAERLQLDAARSVPLILATPPPQPQLNGFGANGIDFQLRAFVARADDLGTAQHELTKAVQSTFANAGITIALPQLDVRVDAATIDRFAKEAQR